MNIDTDLLTFPFKEEGWKEKLIIGGLLVVFGMVLIPLYIPIAGYSLRVMRRTIHEGTPSLPAWDDWGGLFSDGLKILVGAFIYFLPITIPIICIAAGIFALVPAAALLEDSAAGAGVLAVGSIFFYLIFFLMFGLIMLLSMLIGFLLMVAQTRLADTGELNSMLAFREVWNLARDGFKSFLIAYIVYFGISMGVSFAMQILMATIILACLFPFIIAISSYYIMVMQGALFGLAYREAQTSAASARDHGPDAPTLDAPAET